MCKIFNISKQYYYQYWKNTSTVSIQEEEIVGLVKEARTIWKRGSGRNLYAYLKPKMIEKGIKIGRDKLFDILRYNGLLIKPKRLRAKTTNSYHHFNKYKYIIKGIVPLRANEIWVSDITYILLENENRFCYLSIITDLYSRKIVGYCVHENLSVNGCLDALKMALKQRKDKALSLYHHSDRGVQYCSLQYVKLLLKNGIQISMTETSDPLDNAVAERINRTLKEEFTNDRELTFASLDSAQKEILKFVDFYNNQRKHSSIAHKTPKEAHQCTGPIQRLWKSYYKKIL